MTDPALPRILIVDDLFGREVIDGVNRERENLCAKLLLRPVDIRGNPEKTRFSVERPIAEAVFFRGQTPVRARVGDTIENDLEATMALVRRGWLDEYSGQPRWAMVLLDLCFYTGRVTAESNSRTPGMPSGRKTDDEPERFFGLTLLEAITRRMPGLPVVVLSSKSRTDVSLELSRRGALAFVARDDDRASDLVEQVIWYHGLLNDGGGQLIGSSLPLRLALREARRAARHGENILIRGDRGTGKELFVDYAHRVRVTQSWPAPRRAFRPPLVKAHAALLSSDTASAELFGTETRVTTGADAKAGLFEAANGGDLFLDEIGDLAPEVQLSVLRVLQERSVTRVGGRRPIDIDIRLLSVTNVAIEESGTLREDLLERLRSGGTLWLPRLVERRDDIPDLARHFVVQAEKATPDAQTRVITEDALELLQSQSWPGNVRQLKSMIFEAVARFPDVEYLVPAHLSSRTGAPEPVRPASAVVGKPSGKSLAGALEVCAAVEFTPDNVAEWAGTFGEVSRTHSDMAARMLEAALHATRRRSAHNPAGDIQIHPAVKLLTGDASLSASRAADIVKRILKPIENQLEGDLSEAYNIANRLRPRGKRGAGA